jgi:hypothetical protein
LVALAEPDERDAWKEVYRRRVTEARTPDGGLLAKLGGKK